MCHQLPVSSDQLPAARRYKSSIPIPRLEATWSRTADHLAQGHDEDETAADPDYPRYAEKAAERLHKTNIRVMYSQLTGNKESNS